MDSLALPIITSLFTCVGKSAPDGQTWVHLRPVHKTQGCLRASIAGVPAAVPQSAPSGKMASAGHSSTHLPQRMQCFCRSSSCSMPGGRKGGGRTTGRCIGGGGLIVLTAVSSGRRQNVRSSRRETPFGSLSLLMDAATDNDDIPDDRRQHEA